MATTQTLVTTEPNARTIGQWLSPDKWTWTTQNSPCVGAGIRGGFVNTEELKVMKYNEAMASKDKEHWKAAVDEEYARMRDNKVFKAVKREDVPDGANIIDSTWAMKKKANGTYRARMAARGFKQQDGKDYREDTKAAPVVAEATIMIVLILILDLWHEVCPMD